MSNIPGNKTRAATFAFNAAGMMADTGRNQAPWRRAALRQLAEQEFARLGKLRPHTANALGD